MRIGIDLDQILADFLSSFLVYYNNKNKTNWKYEDMHNWSFWKVFKISKEDCFESVEKFFNTNEFKNIEPIKGSINVVNDLKKSNELFLITARPSSTKENSIKWLNQHFKDLFKEEHFCDHLSKDNPKIKKSTICKKLDIDLMIDDAPENLIDCFENNIKSIALKQPWNVDANLPKEIILANDWEEILEIIKEIK